MKNPKDVLSDIIKKRNKFIEEIQELDFLINSGIKFIDGLPDRWYVENPNPNVFDYLETQEIISNGIKDDYVLYPDVYKNCGFGMIYGNYAFVPADVNYFWEISQGAFDYFYDNIYKKNYGKLH